MSCLKFAANHGMVLGVAHSVILGSY